MPTESNSTTELKTPTWYKIAMGEIGVHELGGAQDNPRIQEYLSTTTMGMTTRLHDETAWCSAFVNWCLTQAGIKGTRSAAARSWLAWGQPLPAPRFGCIVVFSRDNAGPTSGHVAFYAQALVQAQAKAGRSMPPPKTVPKSCIVLGGNQNNMVCAAPYAIARVLGYRWPLK